MLPTCMGIWWITHIIDSIPTRVNASTLTVVETKPRLSCLRVSQARRKLRNIIASTPRQRIIKIATTIADTLPLVVKSLVRMVKIRDITQETHGKLVVMLQYVPFAGRWTTDGSDNPILSARINIAQAGQ